MIINNQITATAGLYLNNLTRARNGYANRQPTAKRPDEAFISEQGRTVASALKELRTTAGDVRYDKVERLRAQIEAGTYFVSSDKIAESMLGVRY